MLVNQSKRIPYDQLVIGLDKLFFARKLENMEQAEEQADIIEAYMEACGWTWDDLNNHEETSELQTKPSN